jgi:hypothetical protein
MLKTGRSITIFISKLCVRRKGKSVKQSFGNRGVGKRQKKFDRKEIRNGRREIIP